MNKTTDLTKGNATKLILAFALPIFLGNLLQEIYNISDTMIVSHTLGDQKFAAMGATTAIYSLIIGFMNGISNGFSLVIAKWFGSKDEENIKKSIAGTILLGLIISSVVTVIGLSNTQRILILLKTPDEIINYSKSYISIIIAGTVITMIYNMIAGILRAVGNSTAPIGFLAVSVICNIGLDILFMNVLYMGIKGAAYATVLAQFISVILSLIFIFWKFRFLIPEKKDFKIGMKMTADLLTTGLSMGFMLSIVSIGTVMLQSSVNILGTKVIAAHAAARKISHVYMLLLGTIATASATFASQNYGAGEIKRIRTGLYKSIKIDLILSVVYMIITFAAAPAMVKILTGSEDKEIIHTASRYLYYNLPFYVILTPLLILRSTMQGMGKNFVPLISSSIELSGKVAVVLWAAPTFGYFGIIISEPIIWILCCIFLMITFFTDPLIKKTFESNFSSLPHQNDYIPEGPGQSESPVESAESKIPAKRQK